jgi:hypothetical protein
MSMTALTVLQFLGAFCAYLLAALALPCLLLGKRLGAYRLSLRFFFYFTVGNFFLMNLVFVLQLCKLSNRLTLLLCTLLPAAVFGRKERGPALSQLTRRVSRTAYRLFVRQMGHKTFFRRLSRWLKGKCVFFSRQLFSRLKAWLPDALCLAVLTALLLWVYGTNLVSRFGYGFSDVVVHQDWINAMEWGGLGHWLEGNRIFVDGVYPFGFHCVIYYLHEVFGFDVYVLLRVFCLVQTLMIHFVLLDFLKFCCKSRFAPYVGTGLYILMDLNPDTFLRYCSSLPQEFGMLFILPGLAFLFAFLAETQESGKLPAAKWYLAGLAMSFSMTLSVHFYDAIIAGLFCVGTALGFAPRVLRKGAFVKLSAVALASVLLALLPMAVAYVGGTPLEASLNWGMGVISGAQTREEEQEEDGKEENAVAREDGGAPETEPGDDTGAAGREGRNILRELPQNARRLSARVAGVAGSVYSQLADQVNLYLFRQRSFFRDRVFGPFWLLLLGALVARLRKRGSYAAMLLSVAWFMALMTCLLSAERLGLPPLMDANRSSIYYAYMLPLPWSLSVDAVLYLYAGKRRHALSLLCLFGAAALLGLGGIRQPAVRAAFQLNEAVLCLSSIIRENKDRTWTICSINDEGRMMAEHGYHYEMMDFLWEMESVTENSATTPIPTSLVYFFIEKVPVDSDAAKSTVAGRRVSEEAAARPLPARTTQTQELYQVNRWILMSRMYYWAQAFRELYSNEFRVYYETDRFVCYYIEQNIFRLYDFAIDYGYNRAAQGGGGDDIL